jgi:uncharacterized protein (TIGR02145 family)
MKKLFPELSFAVLCAALFAACGDSDDGANASTNAGTAALDEVYASEDDLPGCIEKYDGAVAFVKEGSTAFKCEDGRWENKGEYYANNDAIKNCTAKREGEVAYIVDEDKSIVCQDGKWVNSSNASSSSSWTPEGGIGSSSSKVPEPVEGTSSLNESSSSVESSSSSSVTPQSSSSETSVSSTGTKSSNSVVQSSSSFASSSSVESSSSSSVTPQSSSSSVAQSSSSVASSSSVKSSSSSVKSSSSITSSSSSGIVLPCKTESEDNCEYGILKDSRDGQEYRTVKIGDQVWMAENLNYAYTGVPYRFHHELYDETYTSDSTSWCYGDDPANCAKYGRLYTWAAAMDSVGEWSSNGKGCGYGKECSATSPVRGVCPKGWHLPSRSEWNALIVVVDGSITEYTSSNTAGTKLKSQTGWEINGNGTDAFGFSALPVGYRSYGGNYGSEGCDAYFWSSSEMHIPSSNAYSMSLACNGDNAALGGPGKNYGYSVRCLKD